MSSLRFVIMLMFLVFSFSKGNCSPVPPDFEGIFDDYKKQRLDLIALFLPNDPVIFEAGGYDGTDSVKFSKKWPRSRIISFEPNPHAFEQLVETTKRFSNIQSYQLALNNYNGKAVLNLCYGNTGDNPIFEGASSLLPASEWMKVNYQGPKIEVPCVVLDDWCQENSIDHIDFMWLDLEGMELQVLQSSPRILETVKVIYAETNFQEFRIGMTQYKELSTFLEKAGFTLLVHWYVENFKGQGNAIFVKM